MSEQKTEEVYISAAAGSRRFDKISQAVNGAPSVITDYSIVATINGTERSESLGEYEKQKFPGTHQDLKPTYYSKLGRFVIKRADGTEWTQADLTAACKELKLTYPDTHPRKGETITETNIHDDGDAFINHRRFVKKLVEGEANHLTGNTFGKLQEDMLRGHPEVMDESTDQARSQEVQFILRNPQVAEKRHMQERERKELAYDLYAGMRTDPDRMRKILAMFGVFMSESASTEAYRNAIYEKMEDSTSRDSGDTPQNLFIKRASLKEDELDLQSLLATAVYKQIIWERAGIYEFKGAPLASTFEGIVDFCRKKENDNLFSAIKMEVESHSK